MKHSTRLTLIGSAVACSAVLPQSTQAGGIELYEVATPDVGLASAGYAARADDASTLFKNPAGMSRLAGSQFQGGLQLTYGNVAFSRDASTGPFLGTDNGGNAIGALPAAGAYFTHQLSERFTVGFGSFSYFGLAEKFNDDWVGRYYVQKGTLLGMSLMPAVSLKATDWLSIGAGVNAMYGYLDNEVAIRTGAPGDGQMKLKDETWGFGANAGILVEPRVGTRLGVAYLSPVSLDFKDTPTFSNLGRVGDVLLASPPQLDLGMTVPQSVMFSIYQELSLKWAVMANVGWQNWNQFGKVDVGWDGSDAQGLTKNLDYQDSWHGAVGAQFRPSEKWQFTAGVAYDTSAVSDANRTLTTPMGEGWRFGLGAQWQISKAVSLQASYEFLWAGDMPVTQDSAYRGRVSGGFNDSYFSFLTLGLNWSF